MRHGPSLANDGTLSLKELIERHELKKIGVTEKEIKEVVRNSKKERYNITEGRIKAWQGHSVQYIEDEMLHEAVDQSQLPSELVHGTAEKHLKAIYKENLKPGGNAGGKNHNHFVESIQEKGDQPGIRNGSEVAVHIDTTQAEAKYIQFWQSKTGVFLTRQTIPPDMIVGESKIVNKTEENRNKHNPCCQK